MKMTSQVKNRLKQVLITVLGAALCAILAVTMRAYLLSAGLLFLLAIPIVWFASRLPAWSWLVMAGSLLGAIYWLVVSYSSDLLYALSVVLGAGAPLVFACILISSLVRKREAVEIMAAERFRIVGNYARAFEFWQKPDGILVFVSPACRRITGYNSQEFLQTPRLLYQVIHPEDRHRIVAALMKVGRKNEDMAVEIFRIIRRDGQEHWVELATQQVYGDKGEYLGKRGSIQDITPWKQNEAALKMRIDHLILSFESSGDGLWDIDLRGGLVHFSPVYAHSLGFIEDRDEVKLQEFYSLVHPQDLPQLIAAFKDHLRGKNQVYQVEYRLRTPSSTWRWVLDRGRIIERGSDNHPVRMIGTHVDITERKRIEAALIQSEEKFRQLAENMSEVFWLQDRETRRFIYVSPAYETVWGRTVAMLYENPNLFVESIHWEDVGRFFQSQKNLVEVGQQMSEEFRVIHPDGSVRWVWARAYPINDSAGRFYRIAGIVEDISERRKSDTSLKESEKRYRDLIEQQGGGVSIIDPNDRVVYINPAGEDVFGVPRNSLTGRNLKEFLEEDQLGILFGQSSLRRQGIESSFELTITRPDQQKRSLLITATPRFDVNNQYLGSIFIFRDITQRKESEERLLYISQHDALTGLYNRNFFDQELDRLDQSGLFPMGVIMIDVDGLKIINDSLGHSVGDELLVKVSRVLKASLRAGDTVARLGGDEFAILMPSTDDKALKMVLGRIFDNVAAENRKVDNPFTLSLSAGGAICMEKGGLNDTIKEADGSMYQTKAQKKNQYYLNLPLSRKP